MRLHVGGEQARGSRASIGETKTNTIARTFGRFKMEQKSILVANIAAIIIFGALFLQYAFA